MRNLFWLSDKVLAAQGARLLKNQPAKLLVGNQRVIPSIFHTLKIGGRWRDVPPKYGPAKTFHIIYRLGGQDKLRFAGKTFASGSSKEGTPMSAMTSTRRLAASLP